MITLCPASDTPATLSDDAAAIARIRNITAKIVARYKEKEAAEKELATITREIEALKNDLYVFTTTL